MSATTGPLGRGEAFLALTNTDPLTRRRLCAAEVAQAALIAAKETGACDGRGWAVTYADGQYQVITGPDAAPAPAQRREAALADLHQRYAPPPPPGWDGAGTWPLPLDTCDRATLAADIRALAPLGRTPRWAKAIEDWAAGVEDPAWPVSNAFFQGAVHAGYATA